jgi:hypothetical protein
MDSPGIVRYTRLFLLHFTEKFLPNGEDETPTYIVSTIVSSSYSLHWIYTYKSDNFDLTPEDFVIKGLRRGWANNNFFSFQVRRTESAADEKEKVLMVESSDRLLLTEVH